MTKQVGVFGEREIRGFASSLSCQALICADLLERKSDAPLEGFVCLYDLRGERGAICAFEKSQESRPLDQISVDAVRSCVRALKASGSMIIRNIESSNLVATGIRFRDYVIVVTGYGNYDITIAVTLAMMIRQLLDRSPIAGLEANDPEIDQLSEWSMIVGGSQKLIREDTGEHLRKRAHNLNGPGEVCFFS